MTTRLRPLLTGLLAVPVLLLAGCGSDDAADSAADPTTASTSAVAPETTTDGGTETSAATEEAVITIKDFAYGDPLTVTPGTEVTVVNEDSAPHNANDADGAFEQPLLGQGESATFIAPSEDGTYDLICTAHPQMAGQLIVAG